VNLLAKLQNALATIVTDGEVQAVYRRTPGEAIAAVADQEGRDELGGLEPADIVRYAQGLRRRRWDAVSTSIPLSLRVIADLEARYDVWLSNHPAFAHDTVIPPGANEALRAVVDLAHDLFNDRKEVPWAAELLVFEVLSTCSRADGVPRGLQAQYPIHAIAEELRAGLVPPEHAIEPHAYAFDASGVRMKRLE
jgi:hypothetical protein